jgi:hypothetical protein
MDDPLLEFKSHIEGKNADVAIFTDRVEWAQEGRLTLTRMTGKALSAGKLSARRGGSSEVIPVKSISSVTVERDGFRQAVRVICSGNAIDFRVGRGDADAIKALLTELMLGKHPSQGAAASAAPPPPAPAAPPAPSSAPAVSITDELAKLAALRDSGVLTEDEFAAQKAKLLGN